MFYLFFIIFGAVVSDPPKELKVVGKTENAIFIQWSPPSNYGNIRGYKAIATPVKSIGSLVKR